MHSHNNLLDIHPTLCYPFSIKNKKGYFMSNGPDKKGRNEVGDEDLFPTSPVPDEPEDDEDAYLDDDYGSYNDFGNN